MIMSRINLYNIKSKFTLLGIISKISIEEVESVTNLEWRIPDSRNHRPIAFAINILFAWVIIFRTL